MLAKRRSVHRAKERLESALVPSLHQTEPFELQEAIDEAQGNALVPTELVQRAQRRLMAVAAHRETQVQLETEMRAALEEVDTERLQAVWERGHLALLDAEDLDAAQSTLEAARRLQVTNPWLEDMRVNACPRRSCPVCPNDRVLPQLLDLNVWHRLSQTLPLSSLRKRKRGCSRRSVPSSPPWPRRRQAPSPGKGKAPMPTLLMTMIDAASARR